MLCPTIEGGSVTPERARLAAATLEDVFTKEGDAVTIEEVNEETGSAYVVGTNHPGNWRDLADLNARGDY